MDKDRFAKLVLVIAVSLLAACNREPQPSLSPVGSWQGTLKVIKFPRPTTPFTAEIVAADYGEYRGVFTLGEASYNATGYFAGSEEKGERFIFG